MKTYLILAGFLRPCGMESGTEGTVDLTDEQAAAVTEAFNGGYYVTEDFDLVDVSLSATVAIEQATVEHPAVKARVAKNNALVEAENKLRSKNKADLRKKLARSKTTGTGK